MKKLLDGRKNCRLRLLTRQDKRLRRVGSRGGVSVTANLHGANNASLLSANRFVSTADFVGNRKMKEEEELPTKNLNCFRCESHLGVVVDGVYLLVGANRFYDTVRFSCDFCYRPRVWKAADVDRRNLGEETLKVLSNLALNEKFKWQKVKKSEE